MNKTSTVRTTPFGVSANDEMIKELNNIAKAEQKSQNSILTSAGPVAQSKVHPDTKQNEFDKFLSYINCLNNNKSVDDLQKIYENSLKASANTPKTTLLSKFAKFLKPTSADTSSCDSP